MATEKGAEALVIIEAEKGRVVKKRLPKLYREKAFDEKIRKQRTKTEARLLEKAYARGLPVPKVLQVNEFSIAMEYIQGVKAEVTAENARKAGKLLKELHSIGIIHSDLTPANLLSANGKLFIIDFGLAFSSKRLEDRATDLFTTAMAFRPYHEKVIKAYDDKRVEERYKAIRKRMRYVKE